MAMQSQQSSLHLRLGGRISAANEQHKDKPVDTGFQKLPPGIRNGVAKLQVMEVLQREDDKSGPNTKGLDYFRAAAVVVDSGNPANPAEHDGIRVVNMQTSVFIPLSDMPAVGNFKGSTFEDNWNEFQNLFKMLGIPAFQGSKDDPTGAKTWAYFLAAMKTLTDPAHPVYVKFSTSDPWKKRRPNESEDDFNKRAPTWFENWHGRVDWKPRVAPPPGNVNVANNGQASAQQSNEAPTMGPDGLAIVNPTIGLTASTDQATEKSEEEKQYEEKALQNGWTQEEISAADWDQLVEMAENPPSAEVTVGSKWNFARRDKNGDKLKNSEGADLPSQEVEVTSVNTDDNTCTVKSTKDGKVVTQIRSNKPLVVKFEWLE